MAEVLKQPIKENFWSNLFFTSFIWTHNIPLHLPKFLLLNPFKSNWNFGPDKLPDLNA